MIDFVLMKRLMGGPVYFDSRISDADSILAGTMLGEPGWLGGS